MPVRELYWNIGSHGLMYILFALALIVFFYGLYQKLQLLKIGRPEKRSEPIGERIKLVVVYALGHKRIMKEKFAGIMHSFIFYGFIILFLGTVIVGLDDHLGFTFMYTDFFLYYKLLLDIAGLLAIVGILMALYRRLITKPQGIDNKSDDYVSLFLILAILVSGFFISGFRLAVNPVEWSNWTPIGMIFANIFGALFSNTEGMMALHRFFWWFHMVLAFSFIAYIPYSKLFHIISSTANQYWQDLENKAALKPIDFEDESIESYGISTLEDFTWKDIFDTEACTRCGRCQDNCPAFLTEKPLSPKALVQNIREHVLDNKAKLLAKVQNESNQEGQEAQDEVAAAVEADMKSLIGEVIDPEAIWSCTTCGSCQEQCPVFVEHVPKTLELRRYMVLDEGEISQEAQLALTNMERVGNPWGLGKAARLDWTKGLEVPTLAENNNPDILYWVGCAGAYDARNQKVAAAVVKIMKAANINFSIVGSDEMCCGDSARRLGNEYLYQSLTQGNIELLKEYGIKKIVTHCPHCFNALKNEYPQMGGDFEVVHHSQLINELINRDAIKLTDSVPNKMIYHDSCYLGRYNNVYEEPRNIINSIPEATLVEFERNQGKSFCCGAGGGRMWMEETVGKRINETRVEQALTTNADYLITGCPFCLTMMDDGIKAKEQGEKMFAKDIAEVVSVSMQKVK
ncbi:MAG: heterodisulfide reductase-related iron-sulfur binding cluster [Bacillota bacterium]|nr:heterodisulfide reductase-related iron-sulfur binding cluster [Bacillota bacterium]